jgi:DNA-binding HxlR family transcriptional regulator
MAYSRITTLECENYLDTDCTVQAALSIIGGKWKLKIYQALKLNEVIRFSAISRVLKDISEKTLTAQLREMEKDGLVVRHVYAEVPLRVEYQLTDLGFALEPVFAALDSWGKKYIIEKNHPGT